MGRDRRADRRGGCDGVGAAEREDGWSDIDLAFGVVEAGRVQEVLGDWTRRMVDRHGAVDHTDIHAGPWVYRVFLLSIRCRSTWHSLRRRSSGRWVRRSG